MESSGLMLAIFWAAVFSIAMLVMRWFGSAQSFSAIGRSLSESGKLRTLIQERRKRMPEIYEKFRQEGLAALDPKNLPLGDVPTPDQSLRTITRFLIQGTDEAVISKWIDWHAGNRVRTAEGALRTLEAIANSSHVSMVVSILIFSLKNGEIPLNSAITGMLVSVSLFFIFGIFVRGKIYGLLLDGEKDRQQLELWELGFRAGIHPHQFKEFMQGEGSLST